MLPTDAVRAGHLCSEPLLAALGAGTATRLAVAAYNSSDDIERFLAAVDRALSVFR
jgi:selenocysteine lyase/cysteine desulfurase